ncbi:hypothetical protein Tco_1163360 [Tanacetum coccineum]
MADLIQKYSLQQISKLPKNQTPTVDLEQKSEKSPSEILKIKKEQPEKQKMSKFTIKSTDKASLKEFDLKIALYQTMHANKSFNRNPANHRLYHALMEALIQDENTMDKGVVDTERIKKTKRSKNDQKPTRNESDKNKSEESAKDHSRISPTHQEMKSRAKIKSKGLKVTSSQSLKACFEVLKIQGLKLQKRKSVLLKEK